MIRRRRAGCVSSCGGTACPARTSAPWRRRCQDRPTRCVAIAVQPSAVGNLVPGASERALSRLPKGQFSHAPGSARARRACTRAVPPTDDRHATGRITDPGCLRRPYHQACRPAHPSACFHHRRPQLRCATRSRKSHRKPIPAPHEIRPGHGPRLARHYIVVASSSTHSRASVGGVGHALAAYRSG
jgi:hypothetical protein